MTESKWGKNIRGYSSIGYHLRFAHSASEQLAGVEWIFKTQQVQTQECSRRTYRVSTVFRSSATSSRHQPREKKLQLRQQEPLIFIDATDCYGQSECDNGQRRDLYHNALVTVLVTARRGFG